MFWTVPRGSSRWYTGRRELGERLAQAFSYDPLTPSKKQKTFVIIGMGGAGKSEVCLKFAEEHRDECVKFSRLLNISLTT